MFAAVVYLALVSILVLASRVIQRRQVVFGLTEKLVFK